MRRFLALNILENLITSHFLYMYTVPRTIMYFYNKDCISLKTKQCVDLASFKFIHSNGNSLIVALYTIFELIQNIANQNAIQFCERHNNQFFCVSQKNVHEHPVLKCQKIQVGMHEKFPKVLKFVYSSLQHGGMIFHMATP